jgi:protein SCO1/2
VQTGLFGLATERVSPSCTHFYPKIESRAPAWLMICISLITIVARLPVVEAANLPEYDRVRILSAPPTITDAELIGHNGQAFQLSSLQGRVALVFFGFTNCPDVCPVGMSKLRELEESGLINPDKVAYVMISVDGERDTPTVMKAYVHKFSPQFIGLTGEPAQVKPIAKNFSVAFFKESTTNGDQAYSVSHSPQIFAIDPAGRLRAEFYNASIEAMAGVTEALINEEQDSSGQEQGNEQ